MILTRQLLRIDNYSTLSVHKSHWANIKGRIVDQTESRQ